MCAWSGLDSEEGSLARRLVVEMVVAVAAVMVVLYC